MSRPASARARPGARFGPMAAHRRSRGAAGVVGPRGGGESRSATVVGSERARLESVRWSGVSGIPDAPTVSRSGTPPCSRYDLHDPSGRHTWPSTTSPSNTSTAPPPTCTTTTARPSWSSTWPQVRAHPAVRGARADPRAATATRASPCSASRATSSCGQEPGTDRGDRHLLLHHLRRDLPADREDRRQRRGPSPALRRARPPAADAGGRRPATSSGTSRSSWSRRAARWSPASGPPLTPRPTRSSPPSRKTSRPGPHRSRSGARAT